MRSRLRSGRAAATLAPAANASAQITLPPGSTLRVHRQVEPRA